MSTYQPGREKSVTSGLHEADVGIDRFAITKGRMIARVRVAKASAAATGVFQVDLHDGLSGSIEQGRRFVMECREGSRSRNECS